MKPSAAIRGDELLKQVATRVEAAFHGKDFLARVGADRFGIVVRGVRDAAAAADVVEKHIFDCFSRAFQIGIEHVLVAPRASVALFPLDGADASTLFATPRQRSSAQSPRARPTFSTRPK